MAHGTKPYGRTTPDNTIFGVADMGELAARLGSINTYDRRGNVTWLDDFESGITKWAYGGVGVVAAWDANHSRNGGFSCALTPGPGIGVLGTAIHYQPVPVLGNHGAEISWTYHTDHSLVELSLRYYDGVNAHEAAIRYNDVANEIQYVSAGGVWQTWLVGVNLLVNDLMFHTFKIVADFQADVWLRGMFNQNTVNLTGIPLNVWGSGAGPQFDMRIHRTSQVATPIRAFHDDAIMTQNEP